VANMIMDHREIEDRNIPDLYLMNKLSSETKLRFEEHFISCPECLSRLEMTEELRTALKSEIIERPFNTVQPKRRSPSFRKYAFALTAAAILISIGVAAALGFRSWSEQQRESVELRNRLAEAAASLEQEKQKRSIECADCGFGATAGYGSGISISDHKRGAGHLRGQ
jgi:hypothetical protein